MQNSLNSQAQTDEPDRPVFGEVRICRRCGKLARERYTFAASFGAAQGGAWEVEYCEHCRPSSFMQALADAAGVGRNA